MKTNIKKYTLKNLMDGFVFNEFESKGLYCDNGNIILQPPYQRNYIYGDGIADALVIDSILKGLPIGLFYFSKNNDKYEVLDGQQRLTSIGRFITNKFSITDSDNLSKTFNGLSKEKQEQILNYEVIVNVCEGTEDELMQWFDRLNIVGKPLNKQEILNAIYCGSFITNLRHHFSNKSNSNVKIWERLLKCNIVRQEFLATALKWIAEFKGISTEEYISINRHNSSIDEVVNYFNSVINWTLSIFDFNTKQLEKEALKVNWNKLYMQYHNEVYNTKELNERIEILMDDYEVTKKSNIFEYVLGREQNHKILNIRVFSERTKLKVFTIQTKLAKEHNTSNCIYCANSDNENTKTRIYDISEMHADHIIAWNNGGTSEESNCQLLCAKHNLQKTDLI